MSVCSRRKFIAAAGNTLATTILLRNVQDVFAAQKEEMITTSGPGSKYVPSIKAAFVRRKEEYGMKWPGQIYDGKAALNNYSRLIMTTAQDLGMNIDMRPQPIYSAEEADAWMAEAKSRKPDGLLVILLDRQLHSWPTAYKAADTGIPTVIFAPVGTAFTTNTITLAHKEGVFICSTDDFNQVVYGMKMLKVGAKIREMRFIVIKGDERSETRIESLGTKLRYVPGKTFIDEYNRMPVSDEIKFITSEYIRHAQKIEGATEQDVINGVKSFVVARTILEREEGDGITMDCLGILGPTKISLPCISWSKMNDVGIPAACEADLPACISHAVVQYLFDRPGFQEDTVPETAQGCLIGSHCSCPTRMYGFSSPAEPYLITHHHGNRDASPRTIWRTGQRITVIDFIVDKPKAEMLISSGEVIENVWVPPSGGCVVAVMVKLDGISDLLDYPGEFELHQLFFYGDYKKELGQFCRLFSIKPIVP